MDNERNNEILRLHLDGMKNIDIARKFGITKQRVHYLIKKAGIVPRSAMQQKQRREIGHLVEDGCTTKEIASITGHAPLYILSVVNDMGLKTNRMGVDEKDQIDMLMKLIADGATVYSLSGGNRVFRAKLYKIAKQRGIPLRYNEESRNGG